MKPGFPGRPAGCPDIAKQTPAGLSVWSGAKIPKSRRKAKSNTPPIRVLDVLQQLNVTKVGVTAR
jgi:hypothetical protein